MDWTKVLKIRINDKLKFTIFIVFTIFSSIVVLYLINLLLNPSLNFTDYLKQGLTNKNNELFAPEAIWIALFGLTIFWIIGVVMPLATNLLKEISSLLLPKKTKWVLEDCLNNLIFQGKVVKTGDEGFCLTDSDSGILLKCLYWKDFSVDFKFNFEYLRKTPERDYLKDRSNGTYQEVIHKPGSNYLGILFRAQDLDNYFMISIGIKATLKDDIKDKQLKYKKKLWLTPHIRLDGQWEVFTPFKYPEKDNLHIDESKPHLVNLTVEGTKLTLRLTEINGFNFKWNLPTHFRGNYGEKKKSDDKYSYGDDSTIPFRSSFGMLGFRAYGTEHVIVKDIVVTRL